MTFTSDYIKNFETLRLGVRRRGDSIAGNLIISGTLFGSSATFSENVYLANDPSEDREAATKKYVDDSISVENLWDRDSSVGQIYPHTQSDKVAISGTTFGQQIESTGINVSGNIDVNSGNLTIDSGYGFINNNNQSIYQNDLLSSRLQLRSSESSDGKTFPNALFIKSEPTTYAAGFVMAGNAYSIDFAGEKTVLEGDTATVNGNQLTPTTDVSGYDITGGVYDFFIVTGTSDN